MPAHLPAHSDVRPLRPAFVGRSWRIGALAALFVAAALVLAGAGAASQEPVAAPATDQPVRTSDAAAPRAGTQLSPVGGTDASDSTPAGTDSSSPAAAAPITNAAESSVDLGPVVATVDADGIPAVALDAYQRAVAREASRAPNCHVPWPLLAGIGRIESNHGRYGGATLYGNGLSAPRIIGIALTGNGSARITDTDQGRLDGDAVFDHAVGPMQFIPSTWAAYGVDGNGDGQADPFNVYDAAAAAADYLCAAGGDLSTAAGQERALRAYNDSASYEAIVLGYEAAYAAGVPGLTIPTFGPAPGTGPAPTLPPVNPGPPPALATVSPSPSAAPHTSPPVATADTSARPSGSRSTGPSSSSSRASTSGSSSATPSPTSTPSPNCPVASPSSTTSASLSASPSTPSSSVSSCPTSTASPSGTTAATPSS